MKIYIVGKVTDFNTRAWEFGGAFDSIDLAQKACYDQDYFIGLAKLNEALPNETIDWPTYWWPRREE